jgi:VWFA-related protein
MMAQEELPERTFRTTVSEVVVPVTVTNQAGSFVSGLEAKDFRLYDNEKLQDIQMDVTYSPISMVVAIQRNSGVEGFLPKIKKIGNMLEANVIGESGEAMLVAYDHRMRILQEWTNDGAKFTEALDKMMLGSSTSAMIDAVFFSVRELRKRPATHRRILLMITETRDKGSEGKLKDALTEAEIHNVIIYTVNINRGLAMATKTPTVRRSSPYPVAATTPLPGGGGVAPVTPHMNEQLRGQQSMTFVPLVQEIFIQTKALFIPNKAEVFTRYTGGKEFGFTDLSSLERALINIGEELHSQYILTYQPNNTEEGGYHEIYVDVNRPGLDVRAREGYWAAARFTEDTEK